MAYRYMGRYEKDTEIYSGQPYEREVDVLRSLRDPSITYDILDLIEYDNGVYTYVWSMYVYFKFKPIGGGIYKVWRVTIVVDVPKEAL